jgi:hypothetical protein
MRKIVGLLALLVACGATWAQAQVAVPEIGPGTVHLYDSREPITPSNTIVPENPAALQWGSPSRIAFGAVRGDKSDSVDGKSSSYNGHFGGLRWVEPRTALALGTLDYHVDFPAAQLKTKVDTGAVSSSAPDWLAWGLGASHVRMSRQSPTLSQALDAHDWTFGLSLRMGEHAFLGGGYGKDTANLTSAAYTGPADRSHYMAGVGLRGGGTLVWHLEADRIHRGAFTDPSGIAQVPGYDMTLGTVEAILGRWLFSYGSYSTTSISFPAPGSQVKGYNAAFGYAPLGGITLTWHVERSNHTIGALKASNETSQTLELSWQF